MKEFVIAKNDAGQRLDRFISKCCPSLPSSLSAKYIRLKRIKVNGKKTEVNAKLIEGDIIQMYINDEFFITSDDENSFIRARDYLDIIYEDNNIMLVNKEAGLSVHEDESGNPDNLINRIKLALYKKGEYDPRSEQSFAPSLCNRIDRNTEGIVIAAKNAEALREMNKLIKDRKIGKYYLCLVCGSMKSKQGRFINYIIKDPSANKVRVYDSPVVGAKTAVTEYTVLEERGSLSLVECRLLTGRTHQIRAQFSHAGHPLAGDGKYGTLKSEYAYQALCSYKLSFPENGINGFFSYLGGKDFTVKNIGFLSKFKMLSEDN